MLKGSDIHYLYNKFGAMRMLQLTPYFRFGHGNCGRVKNCVAWNFRGSLISRIAEEQTLENLDFRL